MSQNIFQKLLLRLNNLFGIGQNLLISVTPFQNELERRLVQLPRGHHVGPTRGFHDGSHLVAVDGGDHLGRGSDAVEER